MSSGNSGNVFAVGAHSNCTVASLSLLLSASSGGRGASDPLKRRGRHKSDSPACLEDVKVSSSQGQRQLSQSKAHLEPPKWDCGRGWRGAQPFQGSTTVLSLIPGAHNACRPSQQPHPTRQETSSQAGGHGEHPSSSPGLQPLSPKTQAATQQHLPLHFTNPQTSCAGGKGPSPLPLCKHKRFHPFFPFWGEKENMYFAFLSSGRGKAGSCGGMALCWHVGVAVLSQRVTH